MTDVMRQQSALYLGSRFKRLAELLQGQAARVIEAAELPLQPSQMPLLATLSLDGPQTIGALAQALGLAQPTVTRAVAGLVELNMVEAARGARDQRHRTIALSDAGRAAVIRARLRVANRVEAAVEELIGDLSGPLAGQLDTIEDRLDAEPLDRRALRHALAGVRIRDYDDSLAGAFKAINAEWISRDFVLEGADLEVLDHPRAAILDGGGAILFAEVDGVGPVGTCALRHTGGGAYELTKMGVLEIARGSGIGALLLEATIARAKQLRAEPLYLLSNRKAEAAIHLYEKHGFAHDAGIMADYGARYARCDVAMRYRGV